MKFEFPLKKRANLIFIAFSCCLFLLLEGCSFGLSKGQHLSANAYTAKNYLQDHGYKVHGYKGSHHYTLNKKKLHEPHTKKVWELLRADPHQYLDKKINIEFFLVTNHPLNQQGYKRVQVSVYVVNGKVVGGTSYPYEPNEGFTGLGYSLDGKTLEQIQGKKR